MEPTALASLLRDYGPYGGWALTVLALVWAMRGWTTCQGDRLKDAQSATAVLTEAKIAIVTVAAALESRKGYFERLGDQVETNARETRQELLLIRQSLDDVLRRGRS